MAVIRGQIRSAGTGVQGLTVRALEQVQHGIRFDDGRCQLANPSILQVGETGTDTDGRFRVQYEPREELPISCAFSAQVRIVVFDGGTRVWTSPLRTRTNVNTFEHDLTPDVEPEPDPSARLHGVLTSCGSPAAGHRIVAFELVTIGFPTDTKTCVKSTVTRQVGAVAVGADGAWSIGFTPREPVPGGCFFSSHVRVEAFDVAERVWVSPTRPTATSLRFDHELYPDCGPDSTPVRVVNEFGVRIPGAEVFLNGARAGVTNAQGDAFIDGVATGDRLVARQLVEEHPTSRGDHAEDSGRDWSYRTYLTSMSLEHDGDGNSPSFRQHVVDEPHTRQELMLDRENALIGFNLQVSVEWSASVGELAFYRDRFLDMSELTFNATDGQFLIERVTVVDSKRDWNTCDYRIYADRNQPSNADLFAIDGAGGRVRMNPYDALYPGTLLHEFGHYGFDLRDEYKAADCWPQGKPVACTDKSTQPGTKFSADGTKDACVMRGNRFRNRKKFCSSHPDNPHVDCTAQGPVDCWTVIAQRYSDPGRWRLRTPVSRGALVDRLPDSGAPGGALTTPPSNADAPESFIPIPDWKPRWHIARVNRPNACPDLVVRVLEDGTPRDGARITLRTSHGQDLYQGQTKALSIPGTTASGDGELVLRGAAVGDEVQAARFSPGGVRSGSAVIGACSSPIEIALSSPVPIFAPGVIAIDRGGTELRASLAEGGGVPQPLVLVERDGEDSAVAVELHDVADASGMAFHLPVQGAEITADIETTLIDAEGRSTVRLGEFAVRSPSTCPGGIVKSARGALELVIPPGALPTDARLTIRADPALPGPKLHEGDLMLVAPHVVAATDGLDLRGPALLHMGAAATFLDPAELRCPERFEALKWLGDTGWQLMDRTLHLDPLVATATIEHLGAFALVLRSTA